MRRMLMMIGLIAALGFSLTGCGGGKPKSRASGPESKTKGKAHDHGHIGPHDGALAEWGEEDYHPEVTFQPAEKQVTVYILDNSAKKAAPIEAASLTLVLKLAPPVTITLNAKPQDGDPAGKASRFVGTHPALAKDQEFSGTISGTVKGTPYTGDFSEGASDGHKHEEKKSSRGNEPSQREKDIFLKPGGVYTAADIAKNGSTVPSVKFRDMEWSHDENLQVGDKVCPVTVNKADEKCVWWVNGKEYEFCCPPCLEKFVKWAKESPEKIKDPEAYRKQ